MLLKMPIAVGDLDPHQRHGFLGPPDCDLSAFHGILIVFAELTVVTNTQTDHVTCDNCSNGLLLCYACDAVR